MPTPSLSPPAPPQSQRTNAQQIAARRNGARSKGPTTDAGKRRSRSNAIKHGLYTEVAAIWAEHQADRTSLAQTLEGLSADYAPQDLTERHLLEQLGFCLEQMATFQEMAEAQLAGGDVDQLPAAADPRVDEVALMQLAAKHLVERAEGHAWSAELLSADPNVVTRMISALRDAGLEAGDAGAAAAGALTQFDDDRLLAEVSLARDTAEPFEVALRAIAGVAAQRLYQQRREAGQAIAAALQAQQQQRREVDLQRLDLIHRQLTRVHRRILDLRQQLEPCRVSFAPLESPTAPVRYYRVEQGVLHEIGVSAAPATSEGIADDS